MAARRRTNWKRLYEPVRETLNREWDPIGVHPEVEDEYDTYALRITRLLFEGADAHKIARQLTDFERVSMGYEQATADGNRAIAERLVGLTTK